MSRLNQNLNPDAPRWLMHSIRSGALCVCSVVLRVKTTGSGITDVLGNAFVNNANNVQRTVVWDVVRPTVRPLLSSLICCAVEWGYVCPACLLA